MILFKNVIFSHEKVIMYMKRPTRNVKPNGDATAFVQRSKHMSARNTQKIKFASYSVYTTSLQRPHDVPT